MHQGVQNGCTEKEWANYSRKKIIFDAWLGPGCASEDWYITALTIQTKICKDGRQVKMESAISIRSLSHKPTIKTIAKSICPVPFSSIFVWNIFCELY